jgi:hypothetical protein
MKTQNSCLHCADLTCDIRKICFDDATTTTKRKEVYEE